MDDLQRQSNGCAKLSADRMSVLEQAMPLTSDFHEATNELTTCLDKLEEDIRQPEPPSVTAEQIREQQEQVKVSGCMFIINQVHWTLPVLELGLICNR